MKNEMERKKNIYTIAAVAFCTLLSNNIFPSIKSYKYRRLCDQYRNQLIPTEGTNRELTDKIGRISEITRRIKGTADSNITDARDIIETVEILRSQIKELEDCCGGFDYNEYYRYWDSYYGIE